MYCGPVVTVIATKHATASKPPPTNAPLGIGNQYGVTEELMCAPWRATFD
jgi:hypothetical protein